MRLRTVRRLFPVLAVAAAGLLSSWAAQAQEKTLTEALLHGAGNLPGLASYEGVTIIGGIDNPRREGHAQCHLGHRGGRAWLNV